METLTMRTLAIAATVALTLVWAAPAAAQDVSGTWEISYTMETQRGSMERTLWNRSVSLPGSM